MAVTDSKIHSLPHLSDCKLLTYSLFKSADSQTATADYEHWINYIKVIKVISGITHNSLTATASFWENSTPEINEPYISGQRDRKGNTGYFTSFPTRYPNVYQIEFYISTFQNTFCFRSLLVAFLNQRKAPVRNC